MSEGIDVHQGWLVPKSGAGRIPGPRTGSPEEDAAFVRAMATLSKRERQILRLRAQGLTIVEIRERCFLADSTVKAHLHSAFRKLDLDGLRDHGRCARACYLLGWYDARVEGESASP
jgi:DNA-binding NarL/FixJ family response regulator